MRVLVVEDDQRKLQRVASCLFRSGLSGGDVSDCRDVTTARKMLRSDTFDLVILDIVLPLRIDVSPTPDAGLMLLRDLAERDQYHIPAYILGLTAADEVLTESRHAFGQRSWTVIRYSDTELAWEQQLQDYVSHIYAAQKFNEEEAQMFRSDVAIVCALKDAELESIRRLAWNWTGLLLSNDDTTYYKAESMSNGRKVVVYAAAAMQMGLTSSAILATKMICTFRPRYLIMAGIAAGIRGMVNLGDVLVAETAWDYGSGKYHVADGQHRFAAAPHQLQLQPSVGTRMQALAEDTATLNSIRTDWPSDKPDTVLQIRIGPVASGAAVLADLQKIQEVTAQHRKVMGVDMETYAVYAAADGAKSPRPIAVSIKGVSDFADELKDDAARRYAAHTSAQVVKAFVERYV